MIGAGPSGLAAARWLLQAGYEPIVFERSSSVGGIWRFDEALADGGGPAYRSLRTNTPKQLTAYSDMPFDRSLPQFPSQAAVAEYLHEYAARFDVLRHIRFGVGVERVSPAAERGWTIEAVSAAGAEMVRVAAVFVCSGMFDVPRLPLIAGLDSFPGTVSHSRTYRDAEPFAGQRVLVVGTGSSGVDIAADTGRVADRVWLSGRNDAWNIPADDGPAIPIWRQRLTRHLWLRLGRRYAAIGDAPFVPHRDRTKLSESLEQSIAAGTVITRPGIQHIDRSTIHFVDGTHADVDAIIFATGYRLCFPFLDRTILDAPPEGLPLYRNVVHPDYPTLFFIGMSRASGPILPLGEMQSRWAAQVLRGTVKLPSSSEMHRAIRRRREHVARAGGNPYRIQYEPYMDLLAAELGVLPRLWRQPGLWRRLLSGPFLAARFRLDGPEHDARAAKFLRGEQSDREASGQADAVVS